MTELSIVQKKYFT